MRIGIDFDNTIACYDGAFRPAAVELGLIPEDGAAGDDKTSIRDHLRAQGREDDWTLLQGHVYGARMALAHPFPGLRDFLEAAHRAGIALCVVSHKTRRPVRGPAHDLHAAALAFLEREGLFEREVTGLGPEATYFEATRADKLARIAGLGCDRFVDDLPEVFREPAFPAGVEGWLFDPHGVHGETGLPTARSWHELSRSLLPAPVH